MVKIKSTPHIAEGIYIKVTCPKISKEILIKISKDDFNYSDQECEICGSHGEISIDYKCSECGEFHEYKINSW